MKLVRLKPVLNRFSKVVLLLAENIMRIYRRGLSLELTEFSEKNHNYLIF